MSTAVIQVEVNQHQEQTGKDEPPKVDTGLHCLILIANYHNISADYEQIRHSFAIDELGMNTLQLIKAARELGLKSKKAMVPFKRLSKLTLPAVLLNQQGEHFVLAKVNDENFLIFDPYVGKTSSITYMEIIKKEIKLFEKRLIH